MNLYYKILIMMFLGGAGAGISLLVLGREIACQIALTLNTYVSVAAAYAGGAIIAFASKKTIRKASTSALNMIISFSSIAGIFVVMGALFFIRYFKVILGLQPEQPVLAIASIILPVLVFLPGATLIFTGLAAGEALVIKEKAGKAGFIRLVTAAAAVVGIFLYLLFLWRYYKNIDVMYTLGIIILAGTYMLFRDKTLEGRWTMLAVITAVIIYLAFNFGGLKDKADTASNTAVYKNYSIIAEKEYPTIKFVMAKKGETTYIFENGFLTYTMPDKKYTEMAKLAQGKNVLIINGGAAGLIEAMKGNAGIREIKAYEYDPYTSYILEKLSDVKELKGRKVKFIAGGYPQEIVSGMESDYVNTVFINPRQAGPLPYSKENLEYLRTNRMKIGAKIVISAAENEKKEVKKDVEMVFGNVSEEKGFITAVKNEK